MHRPRRLLLGILVALVPLALVGGIWLGGHPDKLPGGVRDTLVDESEQARTYDEAMDIIASDYYREVDRDRLLNRALTSAVQSLRDRFSAYFDPKQYASFREATSGAFEGVGMNVEGVGRGLRILRVFEDSPAERAGLKEGDLIIAVDGRSIRGFTSQKSTALIKGRAGTTVKLTVVSGKRRRVETVARERVSVPVVESRMERGQDGRRLGYVSLAGFTSGAHGEVRRAARALIDDKAQGIVLDLRNNGGGLLNEAVLVASVFIPEGVIVTTKGRARPKRTFEASGSSIDTDVPVVVLVNKGSASASEIVAAALQDRDRGTVVGTETFGKGVFQEIKELPNGGALDITVGEYFTPEGRNLGGGGVKRGAGIEPDVRAVDKPKTRVDEALRAALRTVSRAAA